MNIKTLSDIDTKTEQGKLLFAALVVLTLSKDLSILGTFVNGRKVEPDTMINYVIKGGGFYQFQFIPK